MGSCGGGGGGGGCGSHCRRVGNDGEPSAAEEDENRERIEGLSLRQAPIEFRPGYIDVPAPPSCTKCGSVDPAHDGGGLCADCLRAHVFGKFKLAVTNNAMISPNDNLLVAFSGGPASRVVLQFIHQMRCKAMESWDASKSQALPVFGVGVVVIDESTCCSPGCSSRSDAAFEEMRTMVSKLFPAQEELHLVPIESVYPLGSEDGRLRLKDLLSKISDATGKEDMLLYLRMLALQKVALENGYNKLVLGSCASGIARHVIAATVKGKGFSLPADLQYIDARWDVPVVLPLRDCLAQELSALCHVEGWKTELLFSRTSSSINALVSSFVAHLQVENPSREHTIVRTAAKLKPFSFDKFLNGRYYDYLPSRTRCKFQNSKHEGSVLSEVLCRICGSPLSELEFPSIRDVHGKSGLESDSLLLHCCQSCRFQILTGDEDSSDEFYSLLPQSMTTRWSRNTERSDNSRLREQIKDCLLSKDDAE